MSSLTAAGIGALIAFGVVVAAAGLYGIAPRDRTTRAQQPRIDQLVLRAGLAAGGVAVAYLATGWLVAALLLGFAGFMAPSIAGRRRRARASIARTEALAGWAEMLRDTMAAAAGIQEAVIAAARVAPEPIRPQARALVSRMERQPFPDALRAFADELADPVADVLVAALVTAVERQAGQLGDILGAAAASARATATMRLRIDAGRARTYTSVRVTIAVFSVVAGGLLLFNRDYLAPFDTAAGQFVLLIIGGLFGLAFWGLARLAGAPEPARLAVPDRSAA